MNEQHFEATVRGILIIRDIMWRTALNVGESNLARFHCARTRIVQSNLQPNALFSLNSNACRPGPSPPSRSLSASGTPLINCLFDNAPKNAGGARGFSDGVSKGSPPAQDETRADPSETTMSKMERATQRWREKDVLKAQDSSATRNGLIQEKEETGGQVIQIDTSGLLRPSSEYDAHSSQGAEIPPYG